jgi:hypothetical protein
MEQQQQNMPLPPEEMGSVDAKGATRRCRLPAPPPCTLLNLPPGGPLLQCSSKPTC